MRNTRSYPMSGLAGLLAVWLGWPVPTSRPAQAALPPAQAIGLGGSSSTSSRQGRRRRFEESPSRPEPRTKGSASPARPPSPRAIASTLLSARPAGHRCSDSC